MATVTNYKLLHELMKALVTELNSKILLHLFFANFLLSDAKKAV